METTLESARPKTRRRFSLARILRILAIALIILIPIAYIGISSVVADKLSHPTRKDLTSNPAALGMKYESVQFNSVPDNVLLKGWYVDSPGEKVIMLMHGRNSVRDDAAVGFLDIAKELYGHNYDVLMFDFRAHGESEGERYSLGWWETRDIAGALNYLKGRGVQEVGTLAYSMGAATELLAAPDHPEMKAIVADSAFSDLSLLLDKELPKASGLPGFFNPGILFMINLQYGIDIPSTKPELQIAKLGDRPILLIHSETDDLIPESHAETLKRAGASNPNLSLWVAPGNGHVKGFKNNPQEYMRRVVEFFDKNLR
jgi:pimeloyl-ACP methyl ester carboxylesterase